jgi:hypothetical protein
LNATGTPASAPFDFDLSTGARLRERELGIAMDPRLHFAIAIADAVEARTHQLFGCDFAGSDALRRLGRGEMIESRHLCLRKLVEAEA